MKILVIDDEKPTLSMFRLFLAAYGYDVLTAESGEQGLDIFHSYHPDIVFTDIRMPGMDGIEVLRKVRTADPLCQVIIITGHGDMDRALDAMDLDASDFINKPVERNALNSALVRAEKRAALPGGPKPFSLSAQPGKGQPFYKIAGRMSEDCEQRLRGAVRALGAGQSLTFEFDADFSIDRMGLAALTAVLCAAGEKKIPVRLEGLSFNYVRFFEMAGIHKRALIQPPAIEEPEF